MLLRPHDGGEHAERPRSVDLFAEAYIHIKQTQHMYRVVYAVKCLP